MKTIKIMSQAFYGNRVLTEIDEKNIDRFILGYLDNNLEITERIDRTVINIPNTNGVVIIYNKYENEESKTDGMKPLAIIPEENLEIYSRCIACRIDEEGNFENLKPSDIVIVNKYFVE